MFARKTRLFSVIFRSGRGLPGESVRQAPQAQGTVCVKERVGVFQNLKTSFTLKLLRSMLTHFSDLES